MRSREETVEKEARWWWDKERWRLYRLWWEPCGRGLQNPLLSPCLPSGALSLFTIRLISSITSPMINSAFKGTTYLLSLFLSFPPLRLLGMSLLYDFQFPSFKIVDEQFVYMHLWKICMNLLEFCFWKIGLRLVSVLTEIVLGTVSENESRPALPDFPLAGLNDFLWNWCRHCLQNLNLVGSSAG